MPVPQRCAPRFPKDVELLPADCRPWRGRGAVGAAGVITRIFPIISVLVSSTSSKLAITIGVGVETGRWLETARPRRGRQGCPWGCRGHRRASRGYSQAKQAEPNESRRNETIQQTCHPAQCRWEPMTGIKRCHAQLCAAAQLLHIIWTTLNVYRIMII